MERAIAALKDDIKEEKQLQDEAAWIAAINSIRLFVVSGSPPDNSRSSPRHRISAPQPPAPGLPLQAPSVKISTCDFSLMGTRRDRGSEHHSLLNHRPQSPLRPDENSGLSHIRADLWA